MSKTIVEKLNLHKFQKTAVLNRPQEDTGLAGLSSFDTALTGTGYELVFAFVLEMKAMQQLVQTVIDRGCLTRGGYLYMAYPKKGNPVYPTFIHRDELFAGLGADEDGYIGTSDLKFARMVGYDEVFTVVGLKNEPRKSASTAKPSQRVDDYLDRIPEVEKDLEPFPEALAFYRTLTPGYRKGWARYVYSAIQEDTRAKRRMEMAEALGLGFKAIEQYRNR